jgi:hypothetical protein
MLYPSELRGHLALIIAVRQKVRRGGEFDRGVVGSQVSESRPGAPGANWLNAQRDKARIEL